MTAKQRKSTSQTLFEPLQHSQEFVEISNIIHRKRHPLEWEMEDLTLHIDCSPVPAIFNSTLSAHINQSGQYLHAHLGEERLIICLPTVLITMIFDDFGNGIALSKDDDLAPLLLTLGLEPGLEEIEQKLNLDVSLDELSTHVPSHLNNGLEFSLEVKEQSFKVQVFCELAGLKIVSSLLEMSEIAQSELHLKSIIRFQIGKTRVSVADLEALEHGDVIVLDNTRINANTVLILVNAGLSYKGHLTEHGTIEVTSQPRQYNSMDELDEIEDHDYEHDHEENTAHDINLGALQITLAFELGRQQIAMDELSSIGEGYSFTLPSQVASGVTILANGQPIGKGEITRVGDLTGVRVTRLFGRGH
jgi:type III secretion protein Q